jgi:hypothetical protein
VPLNSFIISVHSVRIEIIQATAKFGHKLSIKRYLVTNIRRKFIQKTSGGVQRYTLPSNGTKYPMIKTWEAYIQFHKLYRTMVCKHTCTPGIMVCTPFIGEVLRRSLFDTAPFNVWCYVTLFTVLIPQLQLHLRSLLCVQSLGQSAFTSTEGVTVPRRRCYRPRKPSAIACRQLG